MEGFAVTEQQFVLVVDRTKSVEEVIAAGNYNYANPDINSGRCPSIRAETIGDATLFHLDEELTTDEYLARLDEMGYRAADVFELLVFGAQYPDEQLKYPILALGQDVRDSGGLVCVACLDYWGGKRELDLLLRAFRWSRLCRVLAFRK